MTEKGWAVVFDMPTFAAARNQALRLGALDWLYPSLPYAYRMAAQQVKDSDTHPARVFWVVRETMAHRTAARRHNDADQEPGRGDVHGPDGWWGGS